MTTPPLITYRVTCISTVLYRTEFEIEASSPQEAIDFAIRRNDDEGNYIEPVAEKFLETEDETDWQAQPIG